MGYHFGRGGKPPTTKAEKLKAAKQFFVAGFIMTALAFAGLGYGYWHQKRSAELSRLRAERSKDTQKLLRELADLQGKKPPANNSPEQLPPAENIYWPPFYLSGIFGVMSLLTFYCATAYTIEGRRMVEPLK